MSSSEDILLDSLQEQILKILLDDEVQQKLEEELEQEDSNIGQDILLDNDTEKNKELADSVFNSIENQKIKLANNYLDERKKELSIKTISLTAFTVLIMYQLVEVNKMILGIGRGELVYSDPVISIFITGVFVELIAIVKIMFHNLFPADNNKNQTELIKSAIAGKDENEDKKDG